MKRFWAAMVSEPRRRRWLQASQSTMPVMKRLLAVLLAGWASLAHAQTFTILHTFNGVDGSFPVGSLMLSGSVLYGTTFLGAANGVGNFFEMNNYGAGFTNLYNFSFPGRASCSLTLSSSTIYGMTQGMAWGNGSDAGSVYSISTTGVGFTAIHAFTGAPSDGDTPGLGDVLLADSTLYGTTVYGGSANQGAVFAMSTNGDDVLLHSFSSSSNDGTFPQGGLTLSSTTLYGMTSEGGSNGCGTMFQINTDGTSYAILHNFTGSDGANPYGTLTLFGTTLYGTTSAGGDNDCGVVFEINTDGTGYTVLHNFTGSDGATPYGNAMTLSGTTLYGTTFDGGSNGYGVMFQMNTDGTGYTVLHNFTGNGNDGGNSYGGLILSGSTLYGATAHGGTGTWSYGCCGFNAPDGVVFSFGAVTSISLARHTGTTTNSTYGTSLSFDVTVSGGSSPSGTVTLYDGGTGGTVIGSASVSGNGTYTLTPSATALGAGTHTTIVAVYSGDANNSPSTAMALSPPQVVNGLSLTVTGITASNKTYDDTTNVILNTSSATLVGNLDSTNVVLNTASAVGYFTPDGNVGIGKTVQVSGLTISGQASGNYTLTQPTTTADILATNSVSAPSGMVAWWPGEGNADDIVGGNNGTLVGGVTFTNGEVGQAFDFDGTSGFISVPSASIIDPIEAATYDVWVYFDQLPSVAGHYMEIIAKAGDGADLDLQAQTDNHFWFYAGPGYPNCVASTTMIQTGQWYHVAATYIANTSEAMYVNGVQEGITTISITRSSNGNPLEIGASAVWGGRYFSGRIDEATLYDRALSSNEIAAIYLAGSWGKQLLATQAPLVFTPTSPQTFNTTNALSVAGGSGTGAVSYTVLGGPGQIVNVSSLWVTSGSGIVTVQVTKAADANYNAANVTGIVTCAKAAQSSVPTGKFSSRNQALSIQFSGYTAPETLTNFPALVILGSNVTGFAYNQFLSGANGDLRFTDASGTNELNYEVDTWNTNGLSYLWVQVPALASNTSIWAFWGQNGQTAPAYTTNGATWSNGYVGVWHLREAGGTRCDSTASHLAGTPNGGVTQISTGIVGAAVLFDGANGTKITASAATFPSGSAQRTLETWFKVPAIVSGSNPDMLGWGDNNDGGRFALFVQGSSQPLEMGFETCNGGAGFSWTWDANWHYLVALLPAGQSDLSAVEAYLDGKTTSLSVGGSATTINTALTEFRMGGCPSLDGGYGSFDGALDEVRISNVARSSNWIWAVYANIASNGEFVTTPIGVQSGSGLVFTPTSPQAYNTTNALSVTGGSGSGIVSYAVLGGPGQIVGGTNLWVASGSGIVTVQVTKAADANYYAASATATVICALAGQTITFPGIGVQLTTNTLVLSATDASGLPVTFTVGSGPAIISTGTNLSFTGAGTVSIVASQAGDGVNWAAATSVTNTFDVSAPVGGIPLAHYVWTNSPCPTWPYTNWATAAATIQDAVDAATDGDTVLVGNGIYAVSMDVMVTQGVLLVGIDGPGGTVIDGGNTSRCLNVSHPAAAVTGFTLTHGWSMGLGGGLSLSNGLVDRCVIVGNATFDTGGGVALYAGTLRNCLVASNQSDYCAGVYAPGGTVLDCTIVTNLCGDSGIGGIGNFSGTVTIRNTIAVDNTGGVLGTNWGGSLIFDHSCTMPLPTNGLGNIGADPLFVNPAGDFHLLASSPCINAGTNEAWMTGATDLDGNPRIIDGVVDMGAYESATGATWTITTSAGPNGTVSPTGVCSVTSRTSATFTVTPAPNYHVLDTLVDGSSIGPAASVTFSNVTANHTLAAIFAGDIGAVSPTNSPLGGGVTVTIQGPMLGGGYDALAPRITNVTLCGVAATILSQNATQVVVTAGVAALAGPGDVVVQSRTLGVSYLVNGFQYGPTGAVWLVATVSTSGGDGALVPIEGYAVPNGGTVDIAVVAFPGSHIMDVTLDGVSLGPVTSVAVTNVTANHTLVAIIVGNVDAVVPNSGPLGGGNTVVIQGPALGFGANEITNVTLAGVAAVVLSQNTTQVVVAAGAAAIAGLGDVIVYRSGGHGIAQLSNGYDYIADGSIRCMILPSAATASGALWRVTFGVDTNWHISGDVSAVLAAAGAPYTVTFLPVDGWSTPPDIVGIYPAAASTSAVSAIYVPNDMALIPGQTYSMGIYQGAGGILVTLSNFFIDRNPVTVGQYQTYCTATGTNMPVNAPSWGWTNASLPMVEVTWNEAANYAIWAGKRLPTEAEYECAMRDSLTNKVYPWGDTINTSEANYLDVVGHPTIPGTYPATTNYGLNDISGNVWEWCGDWYASVLTGPVTNPAGPATGTTRSLRGGSWVNPATRLQCATRYQMDPTVRYSDLGFRCASSPEALVPALAIRTVQATPAGLGIIWQGGLTATQYLEVLIGTGITWNTIFTNLPPTSPVTKFTDTGSDGGVRFYRIRATR